MAESALRQKVATAEFGTGFNTANPHCLTHIIDMAETRNVVAAEDIRDHRGNKLWARGAAVSRALHEKLLRRRLQRPVETCLSVENGATMASIAADALARIDENPVLSAFAGSNGARGRLLDLTTMPLPGPLKLLLTSARDGQRPTYSRGVATMIVCAGLASRLALDERDAKLLSVAALIHDIGEMYIDPKYLEGTHQILPTDWKHVAAHPVVGHAFVREFTAFPAAVATSVLHHHERLDGSGYPSRLRAKALGHLDMLVAVAAVVSGIVLHGGESVRARLEVAMRISPDEFDRGAASAINMALRNLPAPTCVTDDGGCLGRIMQTLHQVTGALEASEALLAASLSAVVSTAAQEVLVVLGNIEKSLRASGVCDASRHEAFDGSGEEMAEISLILNETSWRLRNLARNFHLHLEKSGTPSDLPGVAELIETLSPGTPAPA